MDIKVKDFFCKNFAERDENGNLLGVFDGIVFPYEEFYQIFSGDRDIYFKRIKMAGVFKGVDNSFSEEKEMNLLLLILKEDMKKSIYEMIKEEEQ